MQYKSLPFILLALALATPVAAQTLALAPLPVHSTLSLADSTRSLLSDSMAVAPTYVPPLAGAVAGGLIGVTSGFFLGAYVGEQFGHAKEGRAIGTSFMLPMAVYLADGGRGSLRRSALASAAVTAAGFLALRAPIKPDLIHLATPLLQMGAVLATRR